MPLLGTISPDNLPKTRGLFWGWPPLWGMPETATPAVAFVKPGVRHSLCTQDMDVPGMHLLWLSGRRPVGESAPAVPRTGGRASWASR